MDLIHDLPKCELHLHIEGTLEPHTLLKFAQRNHVPLKYQSRGEILKAYNFNDLQSFLDIYYEGTAVLKTHQDFYDLTWEYLEKCSLDNVKHTEIFFDPQVHTERGIPFKIVIEGITSALEDGYRKLGISSYLILCFLRHMDEESALKTLDEALPHLAKIKGVGLDSSEVGHPPKKFKRVFDKAAALGLRKVAHAGEEGPADYIWEAIQVLGVERVDHGVKASADPLLMTYLKDNQVPLTVCPLSNVKLKVFPHLEGHNLKILLDAGLCISVHSDDPAYFGGYLGKNLSEIVSAFKLQESDVFKLIQNSFKASFLPDHEKSNYLSLMDQRWGYAQA